MPVLIYYTLGYVLAYKKILAKKTIFDKKKFWQKKRFLTKKIFGKKIILNFYTPEFTIYSFFKFLCTRAKSGSALTPAKSITNINHAVTLEAYD